jgi:predicted dehydrogenase
MPGESIRIGLIGAGGNTRLRHIPGFKAIPGVELAAVCNRSIESGQKVADEFAIPRVTTNPNEIFDDPAIDAVCIGTWPYKHREYSVRALQSGKHVLCEARMAMDAAEARDMLMVAQATDRVAQLVPAPFDFRSGGTIRRLLHEGVIGRPTEVVVSVLSGQGLDRERALQWRHRYDYSGKNTMMLGIYNEIVQRWLGDTTRVTAQAKVFVDQRVDPETGGEVPVVIPDSIGVLAELANGARATYVFSAVAPGAPRASISVYGSEGALLWEMGDTIKVSKAGGGFEPRDPDPELAGSWRVEADFIDSIREGKPVTLTSFEDGVKYMEFTDAVWRSWQQGRSIDLNA